MMERIQVQCCIAGGGPAGMMLGLLLARAGIRVLVLEKHRDFLHDFRGDTLHPSTLEVMDELGLLTALLQLPHQEVQELRVQIGDKAIRTADFSRLSTRAKFLAFMPQWEFLNFLAEQGKRYATFQLQMETEVVELLKERERYGARVRGVRTQSPAGIAEIGAEIVIGADGRQSLVRQKAGLDPINLGAPMDVLWMRLSRRPGDPKNIFAQFAPGRIAIMIDRGDYWQCGMVIAKGTFEERRIKGLSAFRDELAALAPFLEERVEEVADWSDVHLLTVRVDRLVRWYAAGVLCIGDAAHAMSPIGGVGINLAIQDAVATANILTDPLKRRISRTQDLRAVQRRRELPTRVTQGVQVFVQNRLITRVLDSQQALDAPWQAKLLNRSGLLRRIAGYCVGIGLRPEHVATPERSGL
jgi:2-polyprenyl-6-methoxyphenol hydroxylase-like FAD-dependent oxidoreductase